jgi:oligopeptide transport system substrate-binding protein
VIEKHGGQWTQPGNFVGNGPFVLKERKLNEHILLEKNPHYWNAAGVRQHQIMFLPIENMSTALNLYEKGECDWLTGVPLELVEELMKRPDFFTDTYLGTYFFGFNVTQPPLDNLKVRMALSLAIDRDVIVTKITRGGQKPAWSITPPAFPDYKPPRLDRRE